MTEHPLLRSGDHVCWAVDGSGDHDQLVARWVREGLDGDERLLFAEPSRAGWDLQRCLSVQGVDTSASRRGQLIVLPAEDADGFDPGRRVEAHEAFVEQSIRDGYKAVRIWGEAGDGLALAGDQEAWGRYETLLGTMCGAYPVSALCVYDRRVFGDDLAPFVRAHRTGAGDSQFRGWVEASTVRLSGELDLSNADLLAGLLEVPGGREVVLDMTELDFIDVRGTAEVVRLARRLAPRGSVRIAAAPTSVRTVLECADWGSQPEIGTGLAG